MNGCECLSVKVAAVFGCMLALIYIGKLRRLDFAKFDYVFRLRL